MKLKTPPAVLGGGEEGEGVYYWKLLAQTGEVWARKSNPLSLSPSLSFHPSPPPSGSCNSSRIRRSSYFYTGGRNQYHWCVPCYQEIKGGMAGGKTGEREGGKKGGNEVTPYMTRSLIFHVLLIHVLPITY